MSTIAYCDRCSRKYNTNCEGYMICDECLPRNSSQPFLKRYEYICDHVPSGERYIRSVEVTSEADFHTLLCAWSCQPNWNYSPVVRPATHDIKFTVSLMNCKNVAGGDDA